MDWTFTRSHTFTHVHTRSHTFTHVHTRSHTFTHVHTRSHTFTHVHTRSHDFRRVLIWRRNFKQSVGLIGPRHWLWTVRVEGHSKMPHEHAERSRPNGWHDELQRIAIIVAPARELAHAEPSLRLWLSEQWAGGDWAGSESLSSSPSSSARWVWA